VEQILALLGAITLILLVWKAVDFLRLQRRLGRYYFYDTLRLWLVFAGVVFAFFHYA
jgi:hypothetical protein